MKSIAILWVLLLVAGIAACGSEGNPTAETAVEPTTLPAIGALTTEPSVVPATEGLVEPTATLAPAPTPTAAATPTVPAPTHTPRLEGGPSAPPPTEVPLLASVEIPPDHPAAPLAILPADSLIYAHINIETTSKRPELQDHVEFQLGHFVSGDELAMAEELLATAGARTLTFSIPYERYEWACILRGDLSMIAIALATGAESGGGLSASIAERHAGTDIYALVRARSSGRQSEIYLAILDSETLAASPDLPALREVVERARGALELPHALSAMIEVWGLGDFLLLRDIAFFDLGASTQGTPLDKQRLFGFHATLAEDSTTILRGIQQYDDEEQAAAAAGWLQEQTEPQWLNIGFGSGATINQWQVMGATVYGEAVVPDGDLPGLVQGN